MGQLPQQFENAKQAAGPIGTEIYRSAFRQPINAQGDYNIPAEQRPMRIYGPDYPAQDYGYRSLSPEPPPGWWKQNQDNPNPPAAPRPRRSVPNPGATDTMKRASPSGF